MEKRMEPRRMSSARAGKIAARTIAYIVITALCVVMVFPVYWLVITAVKAGNDISASPPIFIPFRVTAENFFNVFVKQGIGLNLFNSVVVTALSVFFLVLIGSMAAYALSKPVLSRRTTKGILIWILVTRIFPPVTTVIPYFMIIKTIGLIDTRASLVLTYVSYGLPFAIWLMLGFFQELPKEIEEAALVEGYTLSQRFFYILLPLTLPGDRGYRDLHVHLRVERVHVRHHADHPSCKDAAGRHLHVHVGQVPGLGIHGHDGNSHDRAHHSLLPVQPEVPGPRPDLRRREGIACRWLGLRRGCRYTTCPPRIVAARSRAAVEQDDVRIHPHCQVPLVQAQQPARGARAQHGGLAEGPPEQAHCVSEALHVREAGTGKRVIAHTAHAPVRRHGRWTRSRPARHKRPGGFPDPRRLSVTKTTRCGPLQRNVFSTRYGCTCTPSGTISTVTRSSICR